MSKINWEQVSFNIISEAGSAKSSAMEAIFAAKEGNFELASEKLKTANEELAHASHEHFEVITAEAQGEQLEFKVLFLHAEDQLLSTQTLVLLVGEMIEMYKKFSGK